MRGSAAVQVTVERFTVWRFGVGFAGFAAAGACSAWLARAGVAWAQIFAATVLAAGAAAWLLRPLLHVGSVSIRWDGQSWRVGPSESIADDSHLGAVHIHLDFGAWLLLRFIPEKASPSVAAVWLPVQRQGSAQNWHALRCALYAPKPLAAVTGAEPEGGAAA